MRPSPAAALCFMIALTLFCLFFFFWNWNYLVVLPFFATLGFIFDVLFPFVAAAIGVAAAFLLFKRIFPLTMTVIMVIILYFLAWWIVRS